MTPKEYAEKLYGDLAFAAPEMWMTHMQNRFEQAMDEVTLPDVSWCDCNHPLYSPEKDRHLPSCRYGIVMDYLDIPDPRAE